MATTPFSIWMFIESAISMLGLGALTFLLYKLIGHVFQRVVYFLNRRRIHFHPQKQKFLSDLLKAYISSNVFMVILMHSFDPKTFEHYYVIQNVFCAGWVIMCFTFIRTYYSKDWEPVRELSKRRRIDNYVLWILLYGLLLFILRDYLFSPLPYYVVLSFLAIVTTWAIVIWRNVREPERIMSMDPGSSGLKPRVSEDDF